MPEPPHPLAGLSSHDWPRRVAAIVSELRPTDAWAAYGDTLAAAHDDPAGHRAPEAEADLLRLAASLDPRAGETSPFRAGLLRRMREAAGGTAPVRNPFPIRFDAALLAGGSGTRIGGGKPFLPLGDRPLAAWSAVAIARYAERLLVVARSRADAEAVAEAVADFVDAPVVPVTDRPGLDGPVAALLGAADAAEGALLTAPADTPFLPDWAALALSPHGTAVAATDRPHPTVLFAPAEDLRRLTPARSLRATLAPLNPAAVMFTDAALFNVNTPADLAEAEARIARR